MDADRVHRLQRRGRRGRRTEIHRPVAELERRTRKPSDARGQVEQRRARACPARVDGAGPVHRHGGAGADDLRDSCARAPQRHGACGRVDGPDVGGVSHDSGDAGHLDANAPRSGHERLGAKDDHRAPVQHVDPDTHGVRDRLHRGRAVVVRHDLLAGVALESHAASAVLRHADAMPPAGTAEAEGGWNGTGGDGCCRR